MSWEDIQLDAYLSEQDALDARWNAIEAKTLEIRETLLSVSQVNEKAFVTRVIFTLRLNCPQP